MDVFCMCLGSGTGKWSVLSEAVWQCCECLWERRVEPSQNRITLIRARLRTVTSNSFSCYKLANGGEGDWGDLKMSITRSFCMGAPSNLLRHVALPGWWVTRSAMPLAGERIVTLARMHCFAPS